VHGARRVHAINAPALAQGEVYEVTIPFYRVYPTGKAFYVEVPGDTPVQVPAEACVAPE
jgi:hypothetical protein